MARSRPTHSTPSSSAIADALGPIQVDADQLPLISEALTKRWPSVVRYQRHVDPQSLPFVLEPIDWYDLAGKTAADEPCRPSKQLAYASGEYYLQDAGSLLALAAAGADTDSLSSGLNIADLCASPGGKASALLEAIGDNGFLLANEPIRSRLPALQYNLARLGSDRYVISSLDPEKLADQLSGQFDLVVVDAPCSGQALMSRGRQSQSALSPRQIEHSAVRQNRILDAAVRLLSPGGRLVYSTCTFAHAENEAQVERLIAGGNVEAKPVERLTEYQSESTACYRLWPHRHRCAGSFAASVINCRPLEEASRHRLRKSSVRAPKEFQEWFPALESTTRLIQFDSVIIGIPADAPLWAESVAVQGPELAHRTGQTWKPSHAAALNTMSHRMPLHSIEIDQALACQFVSGQPIPCDQRGWRVVRYGGRPLGWVKGDSRTGKNHLPTAARSNIDPARQ